VTGSFIMNTPHGHFSIQVEGPIVHAYAYTPFNPEGIARFFDELFLQVDGLESWILFNHASEEVGVTPEAIALYKDRLALLTSKGCLGVVSKLPNRMLSNLIREIYENTGIAQLTSNDPEEIDAFVKALLASHSGEGL